MLAKRIKIAKFLIEGKSYREIERSLKISHSTVAKVGSWLDEGGEGFRIIAERTKKEKKEKPKSESSWDLAMKDWKKFKRHYPIMFWPELLIEDITKAMDRKQKEKVQHAIKKLNRKSKIYQQINKILRSK